MTARKLVEVICVLAVVCSGEAMPNIAAEYPDSEDYNMVRLTCSDNFGTRLTDAEFLKRAPGQGSGANQLQVSPTNGEITITLSQEEEGYFSCSSDSGGGTSNEIGLAGKLTLQKGWLLPSVVTSVTSYFACIKYDRRNVLIRCGPVCVMVQKVINLMHTQVYMGE